MPESVRTTVYSGGSVSVDVKLRPGAWFAEIRLWRGTRWPDLERTWHARLRPWIPWPSLQRQTERAVAYALHTDRPSATTDEVRRVVRHALQRLLLELPR